MHTHRSREETRARIIDQAHTLFRQYSYTKTTVAEIARELNMSPANIYKFFPSKNALIEECAERNICVIKDKMTESIRTKKGAVDRLLGVVLTIYDFHRDHLRNEHQIYKLVIAANEENWSCVRLFKEFLNKTLAGIIEEGIRSGEFRPVDTAATTAILIDCFTWITNPVLLKEIDPNQVENRARAQIQLIKQGLQ